MENLTNQVLELKNGKNYLIVRQAIFNGTTYFFGAEVSEDGEDITDNFLFFERVDKDGKFLVKEVKDPEILEILAKNIKVE